MFPFGTSLVLPDMFLCKCVLSVQVLLEACVLNDKKVKLMTVFGLFLESLRTAPGTTICCPVIRIMIRSGVDMEFSVQMSVECATNLQDFL